MKLDKAIEIGKDILRYCEPGDPPDEHDAIKLLTVAGERLSWIRTRGYHNLTDLLPGETEE